jgi:hypothetical protein
MIDTVGQLKTKSIVDLQPHVRQAKTKSRLERFTDQTTSLESDRNFFWIAEQNEALKRAQQCSAAVRGTFRRSKVTNAAAATDVQCTFLRSEPRTQSEVVQQNMLVSFLSIFNKYPTGTAAKFVLHEG